MTNPTRRVPLDRLSPTQRRGAGVRVALALSLAAGWSGLAATEPAKPRLLGHINDFYNVSPADASLPHRFSWDLHILYSDPEWNLLWIENNGVATFIPTSKEFPYFPPGQRVRIEGELTPAQGLYLSRAKITVLPGPAPLTPLLATGQLADHSQFTNRLVTLDAVVDRQSEPDATHLMLEASAEGLHVAIRIHLSSADPLPQLEGSIIRATGVYAGRQDFSGRLTSVALWVPSLASVQVRGSLRDDPAFSAPVIGIDRIDTQADGPPVHIVGTVHAFDNNAATVTLRDATGQVVVSTAQTRDVQIGQQLEAVGTPELAGMQRRLRNARVRPVAAGNNPALSPLPGAAPDTLRLADQVLALKRGADAHPVRLFGVATWMAPDRTTLFMQDVSGGIEIRMPPNSPYPPALPCAVRVDGRSDRGTFAPLVAATEVVWSNPLGSPDPTIATLDEMLTGNLHGRWIGARAHVRAFRREPTAVQLDLTTATGEFAAWLPPDTTPNAAPGSLIELRGVCYVVANERHQLTGVRVLVPSADYIKIEQPAPADPFALAGHSIAGLREFGPSDSALRRVRTLGTVIYHEPGRLLCLQDGNDSLLVLSRDTVPLSPGDRVEVVGLPGTEGSRVVLREAIYRRTGPGAEPAPTVLLRPEVADAALDGRLVRLHGTVTGVQRQLSDTVITVQAQKRLFEATLAGHPVDPRLCPEGGVVSLVGVYRVIYDEYRQPIDFTLRLRTTDDVALLETPPLWTVSRALAVAGALLLLTAAVVGWLAVLRSRVAKQTEQIRTQLERQQRLEVELERAQRVESLALLAGGIAHDFNNLLTSILGNISFALLDERAIETVGPSLADAELAALRARDLTQRLLVFTKGGTPARTVLDLAELVRESARFALHGSATRAIFDLPADLWLADVDRVQISQVIQNLALNAAQAMPHGGTLHLALANERVPTATRPDLQPGRYLRLTATDTGTGIPADLLPKIFDPYFTTKRTGNGLGLATVFSIVRRHGGHIEVDSTPGHGATFRLWLPAAERARPELLPGPELTTPTTAPPPAKTAHILVMDDDASIRRVAALALLHAGYEATTAADGHEAIAAAGVAAKHGRAFRLALLDLTVPGEMGGQETLRALRQLDPGIRAIVSSGNANHPCFAAHHEHGFDAALPKPFQVQQLVDLVAATLRKPAAEL